MKAALRYVVNEGEFHQKLNINSTENFSGLREKLFDHDDSSGLCHSKTLNAMKRRIPFVFWSSARVSPC